MQKSADDMIKLTSIIEDADDIRGTLGKLMWQIVRPVIPNIENLINKFIYPFWLIKINFV